MSRIARNLAIALVVSAVLNVFFIGLWAGRFLRRGPGPRAAASFDETMDTAGPMRRVWRGRDEALRPKSEAVDAARRAVRDALVSDPFDAPALESALARLRTDTNDAQVALHRAMVDAARELSLEERRRLADSRWFLRGGLPRGPR